MKKLVNLILGILVLFLFWSYVGSCLRLPTVYRSVSNDAVVRVVDYNGRLIDMHSINLSSDKYFITYTK
jgi:hypothetical protein